MVKYYIVPFGSSGDKTAVPNDTQIDGTVNYTDGYGEDYSLPLDSDPAALAPERDKWNDLWYDITLNMQQYQQHGVPEFITTADNGGSAFPYDIGAIVRYDAGGGELNYISLNDANTTLPSDAAHWAVFDGVNITGNAATATALQTARNIGGVSFNGTASITPQEISATSEAADTSCFIAFFATASTAAQRPLYNTGLTYNSSTNALAATTFTGDLTGTATNATNIAVSDAAADTTTWPLLAGTVTGTQGALTDPGLSYNASTNALTTTTFIGALTGNASTSTLASTVVVADAAADTTTYVMLSGNATGNEAVLTDPGLTYNANTNALTATTFIGAVTGNASTATALATARAIGGVNFDGTADITPTQIQPAAENSDTTCFLAFFNAASGTAQQPKYNSSLGYNASTNALTATTFVGALTGNASTATALANARTIGGVSFDGTGNIVPQTIQTVNEATDTSCFLLFVSASGTQSLQPLNNTSLTFNSNTGALAATSFSGALVSTVTATTQSSRTNNTTVSTTAYVDTEASAVPINSQSVDYTMVLGDAGKRMYQTGASKTFTIPPNGGGGAVAYPVGTTFMIGCSNATGVTVAITTDTLRSTLGSGSRVVAQYGMAFIQKVDTTVWEISGNIT